MAFVSTHVLNSLDGSHASGMPLCLINLTSGAIVFETLTDAHGRMKKELANPDPSAEYELAFELGRYWNACGCATGMTKIALRFQMPQPDKTYHMPLILSPNGYSGWMSA